MKNSQNEIEVDGNNNFEEVVKGDFYKSKKYDSGLEIISPQSNESLNFITPKDVNDNRSAANTFPCNNNKATQHHLSLNLNTSNTTNVSKPVNESRNIIEIRSSNELGDPTNIVIYKNSNGNLRNMTIRDTRSAKKCTYINITTQPSDTTRDIGTGHCSVKRSNTFTHTPLEKQPIGAEDEFDYVPDLNNNNNISSNNYNTQYFHSSDNLHNKVSLSNNCSIIYNKGNINNNNIGSLNSISDTYSPVHTCGLSKHCQMPQDFQDCLIRQQHHHSSLSSTVSPFTSASASSSTENSTNKRKYLFVKKFLSCFRCFAMHNHKLISNTAACTTTTAMNNKNKRKKDTVTTPTTMITDLNNNNLTRNDYSFDMSTNSLIQSFEEGELAKNEAEDETDVNEEFISDYEAEDGEEDEDVDEYEEEGVELTSSSIVNIEYRSIKSELWQFSFDQFDNVEYLNSGAEGVVYKAELDNDYVAMKTFTNTCSELEVKNLLRLDHENIVKFLGTCHNDGKNYLVMEYCSEGELYQLLRLENYVISSQHSYSWAQQICSGMSYLHSKDVIHRDLKSLNVLMTKNNVLKIIDFGFGKSCNETKYLNSFVGTFAWMAPEIIRKEGYTKKVDVWSYGVLIWELLTRKIPYSGVESYAIIYGVGDSCLALPIPDSFPQQIKVFLEKCWSRDLDRRPSFDEIIESFDSYFGELKFMELNTFQQLQKDWSVVIDKKFDSIIRSQISSTKIEEDLIRKRTKELNDARGIKRQYNEKLIRADHLITLLIKCTDAVKMERDKNEREWSLIQAWKRFMRIHMNPDIERMFLENLRLDKSNSWLLTSGFVDSHKTQNGPMRLNNAITNSSNTNNRKKRQQECYSMLEPTTINIKHQVKRKHSMPVYKNKNFTNFPPNTYGKFVNKEPQNIYIPKHQQQNDKKISNSCVALNASSSNTENSTPQKKMKKVKRCSTSIKEARKQLALSINLDHSTIHKNHNSIPMIGSINPSFKKSDDSIINNHKISKKATFNLENLKLDSNPIHNNSSNNNNYPNNYVNNNTNTNTYLFNNFLMTDSIMADSIEEDPNYDKTKISTTSSSKKESSPDIPNGVMLRNVAGRKSIRLTGVDNLIDSIDDSIIVSKMVMNDSLLEKEKKVHNIMLTDEKLSKMLPAENQTKLDVRISNYENVVLNEVNVLPKTNSQSKTSFEGCNMSLWSPRHN